MSAAPLVHAHHVHASRAQIIQPQAASGFAGTYTGTVTVNADGGKTNDPMTVTIDGDGNVSMKITLNKVMTLKPKFKLTFTKSGAYWVGMYGEALGYNVLIQINGKQADISGTVDAIISDVSFSGTLSK